ncbi:MAG: HAD-IA family hydrolase [Actinomycetota bacterium]|nr:HAD-IA family hydrolase [Actinomycetota bacterium]
MPSAPLAVIFDLDGVIRDWNDSEMSDVETAFGLAPGTILAVGFSEDLGPASMTGRLTYREWMDEIRRRVIEEHGGSVAGALDEWEANVGLVDTEMLSVVRTVRRQSTVALLSNATTRLRSDLHKLDLIDELDVIFNTAEIGIAKPDPDVFRHVLGELGIEADQAVFVDDLAVNVEGARAAGITAHQHVDRAGTVDFLRSCGIDL